MSLPVARKSSTSAGRGGKPFNINGIKRLIENPVYVGKIRWKELVRSGGHKPILDREMRERWEKWDEERRMKKAAPANEAKAGREIREGRNKWGLLFKGLLFHADSGQALTPAPSGKARKNHSEPHLYYEESEARKHRGQKTDRFPARQIEDIAIRIFGEIAKEPKMVDLVLRADTDHVREALSLNERESLRMKKELRDLDAQLSATINEKSKLKNKKAGEKNRLESKLDEIIDAYQAKAQELKLRGETLASEASTLRGKLLSEENIRRALLDFHNTFAALPVENRVNLCKLFFKRIDVRFVPRAEVASASGGYALSDGTVVFPNHRKRTQWIEMKFQVQANVDYHRLFSPEARVRISEKLAFASDMKLDFSLKQP